MNRSLSNSFDVVTVTSNGGREHEIFFPRLRRRKPQQANTVIGSVKDMRRVPSVIIFIDCPRKVRGLSHGPCGSETA